MNEQVHYFEDIEIGDEIAELEVCPTTDQIVRYVNVSQMPSGRFTDDALAREEGLPGAIIPGNMSLGFISRMLTDFFPRGRIKTLTANFRATVPHNVSLICSGVVTEKLEKDGEHLVFCDVLLTNEDGERHVQGTAQIALPRRES